MNHAIVELEEGGLNVLVAARVGNQTVVQRSVRVPVADLSREALTTALRSLGGDVLHGTAGVHVVLGDRRTQHFLSTLPAMAPGELVGFVVREALRLTGAPGAADVLVATRFLRRAPGKKLVLGTAAIARSAWEPIAAAFAAHDIKVLGLYSTETCLALAAEPADGAADAPVAMLDCTSGRARFVLCDGQSPVLVRRFLIGAGGETNAATMTTQLAMELPRTFDWLRETGQALPKTLVLGARVQVEDEALPILKGEHLHAIVRGQSPLVGGADVAPPNLGAAMLMVRLCGGQSLPSLLAPVAVTLPLGPSRFVGLAAAAIAGFACAWSAVVDGTAMLADREELAATRTENDQLTARLASRDAGVIPAPDRSNDEARLQGALNLRRPVSRLVADVSNAAEPVIVLEETRFASTDRLVVVGSATGSTRQEALAALTVFSKRLRALPYLRADGQDEIAEVPGKNRFRFKLGMAWRNS
ncbi:MAG: hypothetical protein WAT39_18120 [Planctomycetota bacterium]